jgi:hydrogenase maturation protease
VTVIALGSEFNGDDAAGLEAAREIDGAVALGRPGASLLDWFDPEVALVIVDAVRSIPVGELVEIPLQSLNERASRAAASGTHDLGVAQAFELARALGRPLPRGVFVGVGGARFAPGAPMSEAVRAAIPALVARVTAARDALLNASHTSNEEPPPCTNTGSSPG